MVFNFNPTSTAQVRVWCRPDYVGDLDFANSFAADQLMWFEAYTGVNDAVPKVGEKDSFSRIVV